MTRSARAQPPSVVLDILGRRVRVDAGGHGAAAQVEALWSRCRLRRGTGSPAEQGDETLIALPWTDQPLDADTVAGVAAELRAAARFGARDRLVLLRAAAVATPAGAVVGLVCDDDEQRASAVAELSRRGFGYVTDRLLATDESFDVQAFPEPIAFARTGDETPLLAGPDALGLRSCPAELHLAAMVALEHDQSRREPEL